MSEKLPQHTSVLIKRLRRMARRLRTVAEQQAHGGSVAVYRAEANLCDQVAGRLEEFRSGKTDAQIAAEVDEAHEYGPLRKRR